MELIIQDFFENYLKKLGAKYEREYKLESSVIDFVVNFDGIIHGIEVKSSYSNIYTAIGQLINFSRYFSHLILVTTRDFLNRINKIIEETGTLKQLGLIVFENGNFIEIKKPTPPRYYLKEIGEIREKKKPYKNEFTIDRFTESEKIFFKKFKDRTFMICDITKELKKSPGVIYRFVLTLRKLGFIEEVSAGWRPKSFRITNKLRSLLSLPTQT